jgi:hypothetical protein
VVHVDVKDASAGVLKDLKRFQGEKEDDLKRYMVCPVLKTLSPATDSSVGCLCQMPHRLGQTQPRTLEGGEEGG